MMMFLEGCDYIYLSSNEIEEDIDDAKEDKLMEEYKVVNDNRFVDMTDDEIRLLCNIYIDEDRIREYKLYDYQKETLYDIRLVQNYLDDKYGKKFYIQTYVPGSLENSNGEAVFYDTENENQMYSAVVKEDDNMEHYVEDNYYSFVIGKIYDEYVEATIKKELGIDCISYTNFLSNLGEEYDGTSLEPILELGRDLSRDTFLFFNTEDNQISFEEKLTDVLKKNSLFGSYALCLGPTLLEKGRNAEELKSYVLDGKDSEVSKIRFSVY